MSQNVAIGEKIKALRTAQNLTLKQLSEMTNLSIGFLSQMERGLSSIAIDTLENIANVLGVSLGSFFEESAAAPDADPVIHSFSLPATPVSPQIIQSILSQDVTAFDFLPRIFTLLPFANADEENLLTYLTGREEEVLDLLTQGNNYKAIAGKLFISETTVKTHVNNIFQKLQVNDRTQAVLYALNNGFANRRKAKLTA